MQIVSSIFDKLYLGRYYYYSTSNETAYESTKFYVGVALTIALPSFILSVAFGSILILVGMVICDALGVLLGYLVYSTSSESTVQPIPLERPRRTSGGGGDANLKEAA